MCASSASGQPSPQEPQRSSNLQKIDRLIEAIGDKTQDPLSSLTSSLESAYANFGIFDSLTLAGEKIRPRDDAAYDQSDSALCYNVDDLEDCFDGEDMDLDGEEEDDDLIDAMLRESKSKWGEDAEAEKKVSRAGPRRWGHRRSGVRRGGREVKEVDFVPKTIAVPTKKDDGPAAPADDRLGARVSATATLKDRSEQKQRSARAA